MRNSSLGFRVLTTALLVVESSCLPMPTVSQPESAQLGAATLVTVQKDERFLGGDEQRLVFARESSYDETSPFDPSTVSSGRDLPTELVAVDPATGIVTPLTNLLPEDDNLPPTDGHWMAFRDSEHDTLSIVDLDASPPSVSTFSNVSQSMDTFIGLHRPYLISVGNVPTPHTIFYNTATGERHTVPNAFVIIAGQRVFFFQGALTSDGSFKIADLVSFDLNDDSSSVIVPQISKPDYLWANDSVVIWSEFQPPNQLIHSYNLQTKKVLNLSTVFTSIAGGYQLILDINETGFLTCLVPYDRTDTSTLRHCEYNTFDGQVQVLTEYTPHPTQVDGMPSLDVLVIPRFAGKYVVYQNPAGHGRWVIHDPLTRIDQFVQVFDSPE